VPGKGPFSADYPFESKYTEIDGVKMHYLDEGEGQPFILLHGNSTWSYMWRNIIPHLTKVGRCIAPDLVGFGKSEKIDSDYRYFDHYNYLEKFLDSLELDSFVMVLHDWGGGLGFNYAMSHQDKLKGLAFFETFVRTFDSWDDWPQDLKEGFQAFRDPDVGYDLIVNKNVFMEEILPYGVHRGLTDEEMKMYLEPFKDPASRKPLWVWPKELPIENDPEDVSAVIKNYLAEMRKSQVPKLLFHVQPGAIVPPETVEKCKAEFPNLEDVFLGASGHYVADDFPHEIGEKVVSWSKAFI